MILFLELLVVLIEVVEMGHVFNGFPSGLTLGVSQPPNQNILASLFLLEVKNISHFILVLGLLTTHLNVIKV